MRACVKSATLITNQDPEDDNETPIKIPFRQSLAEMYSVIYTEVWPLDRMVPIISTFYL